MFFLDSQTGDFFTMTIDKESLEKITTKVDIAEDIRFKSNQYIQFPSSIGVSGECHKKQL